MARRTHPDTSTVASASAVHLAPAAAMVAVLGSLTALVGTYWDDAWHTDRGRDTFFVPPHLTLYIGILAALIAVATGLRRPWSGVQRLAAVGGVAVMTTGPVDEAWHRAFGRDSVIWSPPHMLAVAASLALATGVLALCVHTPGVIGTIARLVGGAAVFGTLQTPVLEFDSDVPQFAVWTYIPVAVAGWLLAMVLVRRILAGAWTLTSTVLVYTVVRIGIVLLLAGLDHSGTTVPPLLVLAVIDDVLARRTWSERRRLALQAALAPIVWFVWLAVVGIAATVVPGSALPASSAATLVAAVVVAVIAGSVRTANTATVAALFVVLSFGGLLAGRPSRAAAHDPGQGSDIASAVLEVHRDGPTVEVVLTVGRDECEDLTALRTVARRAGTTRVGNLVPVGPCQWHGAVAAPDDGRVFVYVELDQGGRHAELWAPLARDETSARIERPLYRPPERPAQSLQLAAGIVLYGAVLGLFAATAAASRRLVRNERRK